MDQITRMLETSAAAAAWGSLKEGPHDDETLARLCIKAVLQFINPSVLESVTAALCGRDVDGCAPNMAKSSAEKARGMVAFRAGDLAQASSAFTTALANLDELAAPNLAAALYLNRAAIDLKEGEAGRAMANCNCALQCEAGNAKALYRRAQARAALGDVEGARADVEALRLSGKATDQEADALLEHVVLEVPANIQCQASALSPPLLLPHLWGCSVCVCVGGGALLVPLTPPSPVICHSVCAL